MEEFIFFIFGSKSKSSSLTEIEIGDSVFKECSSLTQIIFRAKLIGRIYRLDYHRFCNIE